MLSPQVLKGSKDTLKGSPGRAEINPSQARATCLFENLPGGKSRNYAVTGNCRQRYGVPVSRARSIDPAASAAVNFKQITLHRLKR